MKTLTVKSAKRRAWKVFSIYIRNRDTNYLGTQCYTCGKYFKFNETDAGHFQDGRFKEYLFDERQVHAQCKRCNGKKPFGLDGNKIPYTLNMIRDYGEEEVEKMVANKYKLGQWKVFELDEIYQKYKAKVKEYEKTN
jgi:hypothetical protein